MVPVTFNKRCLKSRVILFRVPVYTFDRYISRKEREEVKCQVSEGDGLRHFIISCRTEVTHLPITLCTIFGKNKNLLIKLLLNKYIQRKFWCNCKTHINRVFQLPLYFFSP